MRYLHTQLPIIGIAGTVVLLALAGAETFIDARRLADTMSEVDQTRQILARLDEISLNVERAVSTVRVFVLVGEENILAPLTEIERQIDDDLSELRDVFADDPDQSAKLVLLTDFVGRRLALADEYVELRRVLGLQETVDAIPAGGEALATAIRRQIAEMQRAEQLRLERRQTDAAGDRAKSFAAMLLTGLVSFLCLILGFTALRRQISSRKAAEERLNLSEGRLREAQRIAKIGNWSWDIVANKHWWSQELYRMLELKDEGQTAPFEQFLERVPADDRDKLEKSLEHALSSGVAETFDLRVLMRDGTEKIFHSVGDVSHDADGRPIRMSGTFQDITESKQAEEALRESEERYATTIQLAGIGICHVGPDSRFLWVNQRLCEMLGYAADELLGLTTKDISHPDDLETTTEAAERLRAGEIDAFEVEKRYLRKDGETIWVRLTVTVKRGADGTPLYAVSIIDDISNRKRAEARVKYLASHDEMTGLPNRGTFGELLKHAIRSARRHDRQCAVLFIDLDRFKDINDTLGHRAGDQLLRVISRRLRGVLRDTDTAARLGGDEFCVLAEDIEDSSSAGVIAEKCLQAIAEPITIAGRELQPRASIGITLFPNDGQDYESLLQNADSAMYAAKQAGSHRFAFYTPQLTVAAERRMSLEHDLRRSVRSGEFVLHYQPQILISSGRLVSLEALVRWDHPKRGLIAPGEFIDVAERIGLIEDLGEWVLESACRQAVSWNQTSAEPVRVAVNISSRHFREGRIVSAVAATLEETGLDPDLLEIEITEHAIQTSDDTIDTFSRLRELGVQIAIDDFGTGYAWLDSLRQLPVNALKIDRRFVRDLLDGSENAAILATIVAMGRAMNLSVVAEGVETLEQVQWLHAAGCDMAQGFYFSGPVPDDGVLPLLRRSFLPASGLDLSNARPSEPPSLRLLRGLRKSSP